MKLIRLNLPSLWIAVFLSGLSFLPEGAYAQQRGTSLPQTAQAILQNAGKLELTKDQQAAVQSAMQAAIKEYNQLAQAERGKPGLKDKLAEVRSRAFKKGFAILTKDQQEKWRAVVALGGGASGNRNDEIARRSLIIPTIEELKNPPERGAFGPSTALAKTPSHPPLGEAYVIITDHTDEGALKALARLAKHREGVVIEIPDLGTLHESPDRFEDLREKLIEASPRFVAIAPRPESYRENMHLCMLKLLAGLDEDAELDAFPGYLMAQSPEVLAELIERTIQFQPLDEDGLRPATIGAIEDENALRYRSYQKAKVLQKFFDSQGVETPSIIITTRKSHMERDDFPVPGSGDEKTIIMHPASAKHTFATLSQDAEAALSKNNLLYMFGHGTVGRIVGADIDAFAEIDFANEIVFCGSCMSATPVQSDRLPPAARKPETARFAQLAVENGAVLVLGHLGLCGGFPKIYPMSELILEGKTAGEAYQRLMNGLIQGEALPNYFSPPSGSSRPNLQGKGNNFLYILLGDPALAPIQ